MIELSIVVVSYNSETLLDRCIGALKQTLKEFSPRLCYEIIVVDNHSRDKTRQVIERFGVRAIFNQENRGFPRANNQAIRLARGRYLLFLNPDVICGRVNFQELLEMFKRDDRLGALTVSVRLENGELDPACHRGFPTLTNALCYFLKLEKLGGSCGGYHLVGKDLNTAHEIDSGSGAFFLTRKALMDELKGFDEDFFMYGEDLDLSFRIKEKGLKIIYYPRFQVTHLKHQSGFRPAPFFDAMGIFYRKHYERYRPWLVNRLVQAIIELRKLTS